MPLTELASSQLADPFRIGLILALVLTMFRTRAQTGTWLPLLAGLVFVAVIIPSTLPGAAGEPLWRQVAVGLGVNTALAAVILGVFAAVRRLRS